MERRTLRNNNKSKTRNAKPYDRPNQTQQQQQQQNQQSIFGRVASKFKGILNPSWIFNVSQWMGTPDEDPDPGSSTDPQDEESGEEEETREQTPAPTAHCSKRPRLSLIDPPAPPPPILSEGTQTWLDTPSLNMFSPSSILTSTVNQNSLIENKADEVIVNGDDHSENSEGSASTSGCSSLVSSHKDRSNCLPIPNRRLVQSPFDSLRSGFSRRDVTSRKESLAADTSASRMSLWSGNRSFSPAAKMQQRSPVVGQSNQPSFNVGAFMGTSKTSQQSDKKVASPFYQGKTSFGGASSTRRMPVSVAPYQVDRPAKNQIKVRPKECEDSLEGMSSAAKRILMTLEKMSSPVTDAKKIPNTNRSPVDLSLYLMPPRLRSNVVSTPTTSKGPPIANISTISKLTTLKSCMRLHNKHLDANTSRSEWVSGPKDTRIIPPASDTTQQSNQESIPPPLSPNKGPGKMRCNLTKKHQSSARTEEYEDISLPSIPLPISNLPIFKTMDSIAISQSNKVTNEKHKTKTEFEFSPPIEVPLSFPPLPSMLSFSNSDKPKTVDKLPFTFSSPTELEPSVPVPGLFSRNLTSTNWSCSSCWVQNPDKEVRCMACEAPRNNSKTSKEGAKTQITVTSTATKPSASWSCQECWVSNPGHETKCLACETPKQAASSGLVSHLKKSTTTWSCQECWTSNPESTTKCLACEAVKKGAVAPKTTDLSTGFGGSSSLKSSTWSCDSCWTQNPVKEAKCLACEAPNPSKEKSSGSSSKSPLSLEVDSQGGFKFGNMVSSTTEPSPFIKAAVSSNEVKKPAEQSSTTPNGALKISSGSNPTWECDTCLVRNPQDKLKCIACETIRPSKRGDSGLKDSESFKFSSPLQNSPITFKFGSYSIPAATTTAASSSSFGNLSSTGASSFFATAASTASSDKPQTTSNPTVSGFKFGSATVPQIKVTKPEIPVVDLEDSQDAVVQPANIFGSTAKKTNEDSTTSNKTFNIATVDKPSDSGISSLFKPPTSTSTDNKLELKSTLEDSKPTMSLFKFGTSNQQPKETPTSSVPVIDLVNDSSSKTTNIFAAAAISKADSETTNSNVFSITPSIGGTNFALPTSTDNKLSPFALAKDNSTPALQSTLNSTPVSSQTAQSKETPAGGFNFKAATASSGTSAFGVFSMPSDTNKLSSSTAADNKPSADSDKKSDSPFNLGVSSSSNPSPFTMTSSSPATFKMANQLDASSTTKSPFGAFGSSAPTSSSGAFASTAPTSSSGAFGSTAPTSSSGAFGSTAPTSSSGASMSLFTFGAGPTTTSSLGAGQTTTSTFGSGLTTTSSFGAATTTSSLQFPTKSLDTKPAASFGANPTTSSFSFGNVATATTTQATAPSGGFSFFAGPTSTAAPTPSLFTFGASSNASQPPKTGGFPTATTNTTSVFGAPVPASSASTFMFGATKTEPVNSTPSNFAFGSGTTPSAPASNFSGFQQATTQQPASNVFQFGSQPSNPTAAFGAAVAAGGFAFAAKSDAPSQMAPASSQAAAPAFGAMQQQPMFGSATAPTFGGGTATAASAPFVFGNATSSSGGSGFSFGTPQQDSQNAGQFQAQPQFNISTPPTFNFGATSTQSGPFQFAASSTTPAEQTSTGPRRIRKAVRRVRN